MQHHHVNKYTGKRMNDLVMFQMIDGCCSCMPLDQVTCSTVYMDKDCSTG